MNSSLNLGKVMMTLLRVTCEAPTLLSKGHWMAFESLKGQVEESNYPCALESDMR